MTLADIEASGSKIAGIRAEFATAAGILPETLKVEVFENSRGGAEREAAGPDDQILNFA